MERECGRGRLQQRSGTCWLNTSLNMLLLSSNIYNDLVTLYPKEKFTSKQIEEYLTIIKGNYCPILPANTREPKLDNYQTQLANIKKYIFAHIYQACCIDDVYYYTPIEQLAITIKRVKQDDSSTKGIVYMIQ